jgi:predicted dehydrogenase
MIQEKAVIGFIGSGGIARPHAYSLNSLKYFYGNAPDVEFEAVCSATKESRIEFARQFGFNNSCDLKEFAENKKIDTVFILGPNNMHYEHLKTVIGMPGLKRIYLEKPVCSNSHEENAVAGLTCQYSGIKIQVGFQYLFSAAVRKMLLLWKSGKLGKPIHFDVRYYHSDYLKKDYREKRASRLTPAPDGGAMADLGSHGISLLLAFLGNKIKITGALQAGSFEDVTADSDLFSLISLYDYATGAAGTLSASRISSGTGDYISFELFAEKGALRYSTSNSDTFEYFTEESGIWSRQMSGSDYRPSSSFPSVHVPSGWLRAMIHAHYVFLTGTHSETFIPDIEHGLEVQKLVTQTAEHLKVFRDFTTGS